MDTDSTSSISSSSSKKTYQIVVQRTELNIPQYRGSTQLYTEILLPGCPRHTYSVKSSGSESLGKQFQFSSKTSSPVMFKIKGRHSASGQQDQVVGQVVTTVDKLLRRCRTGQGTLTLRNPQTRQTAGTISVKLQSPQVVDCRERLTFLQSRFESRFAGTSTKTIQQGSLQSLHSRLGTFVSLLDKASKIHPYAESAWMAISLLYSANQKRITMDRDIKDLVQIMNDIMYLIEQVDTLEKKSKQFKNTIQDVLRVVTECGTSINDYVSNNNIAVCTWKAFVEGKHIKSYKEQLNGGLNNLCTNMTLYLLQQKYYEEDRKKTKKLKISQEKEQQVKEANKTKQVEQEWERKAKEAQEEVNMLKMRNEQKAREERRVKEAEEEERMLKIREEQKERERLKSLAEDERIRKEQQNQERRKRELPEEREDYERRHKSSGSEEATKQAKMRKEAEERESHAKEAAEEQRMLKMRQEQKEREVLAKESEEWKRMTNMREEQRERERLEKEAEEEMVRKKMKEQKEQEIHAREAEEWERMLKMREEQKERERCAKEAEEEITETKRVEQEEQDIRAKEAEERERMAKMREEQQERERRAKEPKEEERFTQKELEILAKEAEEWERMAKMREAQKECDRQEKEAKDAMKRRMMESRKEKARRACNLH